MTTRQDEKSQDPLSGYLVDLFLGNGLDIWMHSYFLAGLVQLAEEGEITLRVLRGKDLALFPMMQRIHNPIILFLKITTTTGDNPRIICFDPLDKSDVWLTPAMEECDVYFKRSTYLPNTQQLTKSQRSKVRPINPIFATWISSPAWTGRIYTAFLRTALRQIATGTPVRTATNSLMRSSQVFASLPSLAQYEDTPAGTKRNQVLFQTRLWDPSEEKGDWVEPCNQHRVAMVRTLRERLGDRCVGGLIRTPYTEKHYPDL